jgi:hypothetical protein
MSEQPLVVTIPHSLGKEEATRRLKSGLAKASSSSTMLSIDEEVWSGDRLAFKVSAMGQQASGTLDVADKDVRVEVVLPWLLQRFAELVQAAVKQRTRLLLEKK